MSKIDNPVPHLTTVYEGPLASLEKTVLTHVATIETWFRQQWQKTPAPLTSSVDLRHAGFKLAPVDTNLFPSGFNNLNRDFLPLCVQAAQSFLFDYMPTCKNIILLPENHTRNDFYMQSLAVLQSIFIKAGFRIRIGSLDEDLNVSKEVITDNGKRLCIEPLIRKRDRVGLADFDPCLLVLNNDLSSGVPEILKGLNQRIEPPPQLGWSMRLKSSHFSCYEGVANEFATLLNLDPWLINPYFKAVAQLDFMAQEGLDELAKAVDDILNKIRDKYKSLNISDAPFVAVKADNGTYGMNVMMVHDGETIKNLNRKQRTRMAASKGQQKVSRVIIQEGVYSFETMPDGAVAEPVVYMIGPFVVGGFYRVHQSRGIDENLNAPGMHFEPLAFAEACNMPQGELAPLECPNRFYVYGVIARLAALAAAREIAIKGQQ